MEHQVKRVTDDDFDEDDILSSEPVNSGGNKIADCFRLAIGQGAMTHFDHDRGLRRPLLIAEKRIVR